MILGLTAQVEHIEHIEELKIGTPPITKHNWKITLVPANRVIRNNLELYVTTTNKDMDEVINILRKSFRSWE